MEDSGRKGSKYTDCTEAEKTTNNRRFIMRRASLISIVLLLSIVGLVFPQAFSIPITVTDGTHSIDLTIGVDPNGTNGYDPGLDLYAPPPPPSGAFDARLSIGGEDYITDIRDNTAAEKQFHMSYVAASGLGPIVLTWDAAAVAALPIDSIKIVDDITGTLFGPIDMKVDNTLTVTSPFITNGLRILLYLAQGAIGDPVGSEIPQKFELLQNYPNPFNPETNIRFNIAKKQMVEVAVYNLIGELVAQLHRGELVPGAYNLVWNAANQPSGMYIVKVKTPEQTATRKMMLVK
ncbi:MAG: hypothetical protein DRQ24_12455 [Candidatus Latescibacterota bacterium]|nr:MAG: hypothetical protein DRQ24_12455 [Candidatus Latescibacterota bacterium]